MFRLIIALTILGLTPAIKLGDAWGRAVEQGYLEQYNQEQLYHQQMHQYYYQPMAHPRRHQYGHPRPNSYYY
jgi:hypothetical protein